MIALLLSCGNSYSQSDSTIPSTGGLAKDSVLVSYDDLRLANAKMTELKYEKEINSKLKTTIHNDSVIIDAQDKEIVGLYNGINKAKKQRNIFIGTTGGSVLALILSVLFLK